MKPDLLQLLQNSIDLGGDDLDVVAALVAPTKMKKPIMTPEVEDAVLDSLTQFKNRDRWNQWGMEELGANGAGILLYGPPGTGKTVIAKWMARQIQKGFKQLSLADIGGGDPGSTEKAVNVFFQEARDKKNMTIFMDEIDHLLLNRSGDVEQSWQIGTTEAIMMQMSDYPGLIIGATNLIDMMDTAVHQRFGCGMIFVGRPDHKRRILIWKQKWPAKLPYQPTEREFSDLANADLNGRQIENALRNGVRRAIRKGIRPNFKLMLNFAKAEAAIKVHHESK